MSDKVKSIEQKPEELIQAEKFINDGKFDEAQLIMKSFEESGEHNLYDVVSCNLLNCELLFQQGLYKHIHKLAEETYKESLGLGNNLLSVDALLWMARALGWLYNLDSSRDIIKKAEELLETLTHQSPTDYMQREALIAYIKGKFYFHTDVDLSLKHYEHSLALREELGVKSEIADSLIEISRVLSFGKGEFERALKYAEHGLVLAEESNKKYLIALGCNWIAAICGFKGELNRSIKYFERSIKIFKNLNSKMMMAFSLNSVAEIYRMNGDLDHALECLEQSIVIFSELGNIKRVANAHDSLIQILIEKGDLERAQQYFHDLEHLNNQLKDKKINIWYRFDKALLLKTSSRARNRSKAEEILMELLEDKDLGYEDIAKVLINLCELLLIELHMTNDLEVLEEINPLISQLLEISEKSHSFWLLCETHLLQAKISLLTYEIDDAKRLLTQAQQLAEKYGLNLLAMRISYEHDELIKKSDLWESLKNSDSSLEARLELARLNDQLKNMRRKQVLDPQELESEQPIFLAIISKDGSMVFSNPFTADMIFDVNRIGDFLSSFNTFSHQIFHDSFDRVVFGKNKVLLKTISQFYICYMFYGQTYSAQQKIFHFVEIIKKNKDVIKSLESADNKNMIISINDIPALEEIIIECFMSDPHQFREPFKAYIGDEPFVFVSYAHANKLEVYPIIDYLNKTGIFIWYDEGIPISENWKKSIARYLENCNAFLVFISPYILNSEMVKKEISFALQKKKKFVAVYLKETKLPTELEIQIADIQALMKYRISESEFYTKLIEVLKFL